MLERVWEEMDIRGTSLVEGMEREIHTALCNVYEQREGR
jgi:hypothetical protein